MNILCISTITNIGSLHYKRELTILKSLQLRGADIDYFYCDGINNTACEGIDFKNCDSCKNCSSETVKHALEFGFHPNAIFEHELYSDKKAAKDWANSIEPGKMPYATYNDMPLGQWCLSSILTKWRIPEFTQNNTNVVNWYRDTLENGLRLLLATNRILTQKQYDALFIYNARMAYVQIPFQIAMSQNIKVYTHERGQLVTHCEVSLNSTPSNRDKLNRLWAIWKNIPLNSNKLLKVSEYLYRRMKGDAFAINWHPYTSPATNDSDIRTKLNIPKNKKIWILFTSSTHEIAAQPGFVINGFNSQQEWIEAIVSKISDINDVHLIIRLHPNYVNKNFKDVASSDLQYFKFLKKVLPPNVTMIEAADDISSYDLMDQATVGFCYISSTGLEMSAKGIHVCIGANAFYQDLEFIDRGWSPKILDVLFKKYSNFHTKHRNIEFQKKAYRFWYTYIFKFGFEFPFLNYPRCITDAEFSFFSTDHLIEGKHEHLDLICDAILAGDDPIQKPTKKDYATHPNDENCFFSKIINPLEMMEQFEDTASFVRTIYMPVPVIFFIHIENKNTFRSLQSLASNKLANDTELHIIYRSNTSLDSLDHFQKITTVFKKVSLHTTNTHGGLSSMIFEVLDNFFSKYESLIIVDDELYLAPQTLFFLNNALLRYRYQKEAFCVNATLPSWWSTSTPEAGSDVIFIPKTEAMGVGIWRDRWHNIKETIYDTSKITLNPENGRHLFANLLTNACNATSSTCITPQISYACSIGPEGSLCRKSFSKLPEKIQLPTVSTSQIFKELHVPSKDLSDLSTKHIQRILEFFKNNNTPVFLNIGCGKHYHDNWINLDMVGDFSPIIPWNLLNKLPLPAASCDAIYSCHSLEHFDPRDAKKLLLECRRILKPSGILRLVVPDLENIARTYLDYLEASRNDPEDMQAAARHQWMIIELVDQLSRHESGGAMARTWSIEELAAEEFIAARMGDEFTRARKKLRGIKNDEYSLKDVNKVGTFRLSGEAHQWMYDELSLRNTLTQCGFTNINRRTFNNSGIFNFAQYKLDTMEDGSEYRPTSLYIEATP